jgi:hypothetical protein
MAGGVGMAARENRPNLPPRVYRDPCPRCGCRGDLDCGHTASVLLVRV